MDRKLKWFLVEYDRHEHMLCNLTEYAEPEQREEAWSRLRHLEKKQFPELQRFGETGIPLRMEYVLLIAESEEDIRVTHGNYLGDGHLTLDEYWEIKARKAVDAEAAVAAGD